MDVYIEKKDKHTDVAFSGTVKELLEILGINIEEVIVVRNKALLTEDARLENNDKISVLSVISGG